MQFILITGSYQIFKFLENLIKLVLFFIDGKILGYIQDIHVIRVFAPILKVKGSNFMGDVVCRFGQQKQGIQFT